MSREKESGSQPAQGAGLALVAVQEQYPVLFDPKLADRSIATLTDMGVGQFDLQRIKIPSGGGSVFEIQTLKGPEAVPFLDVVIVAVRGNEKNWWMEADPTGKRPSCQSYDGMHGFGINSLDPAAKPGKHECASCAWNQFGSARGKSKRGKDCKDSMTLVFYRPGARLPGFITVPPTSLGAVRAYALQLVDAGKSLQAVITRLALKIEKNEDGTKYGELVLTYQGDVGNAETEERIRGIGDKLLQMITRAVPAVEPEPVTATQVPV